MKVFGSARPGGKAGGGSASWLRFGRNGPAVAGALIVLALLVVALLAPVLTPHDPVTQGELPAMRWDRNLRSTLGQAAAVALGALRVPHSGR